MKYDVFLSYSRKDSVRARCFIELFEGRGWNVFWDVDDIPPGVTFHQFLRDAIDQSKTVVTLWSKESVKSRWVDVEAREALERGILYPVLIEELGEDDLPFGLHMIQATDLHDWEGSSEHRKLPLLMATLAGAIGEPVGSGPPGEAQAPAAEEATPAEKETPSAEDSGEKTAKVVVAELEPEPVAPVPPIPGAQRRPPYKLLGIAAAVVVALAVAWFAFGRGGGGSRRERLPDKPVPEQASGAEPTTAAGRQLPAAQSEDQGGSREPEVPTPNLDSHAALILEKRRSQSQRLDSITIELQEARLVPGGSGAIAIFAQKRQDMAWIQLNIRALEPSGGPQVVELDPGFTLQDPWLSAFEVEKAGIGRSGSGHGYNVRLVAKRGARQPPNDDKRIPLGYFQIGVSTDARPGDAVAIGVDVQVAEETTKRGLKRLATADTVLRIYP